MNEEEKPKTPAQELKIKLQELVTKHDALHALKKRIHGLKRLDARLNSLAARLTQAKAAEAESPDDKEAKAKVDALETSIANLRERMNDRDLRLAELNGTLDSVRFDMLHTETVCTDEFLRLVRMGLITKRNAGDVMPLVWQTGLNIGNIKKRRWARPRRK